MIEYLSLTHAHSCTVVATSMEPLNFTVVHSAVVSLSDSRLWIGGEEGLYVAIQDQDKIVVQNVTQINGTVTTLAWRSVMSDKQKHLPKRAFFLDPNMINNHQDISRSASDGVYTSRFPKLKEEFGVLVIGTQNRLYFYDGSMWWFEWVSMWYSGQGGVVDGTPTGLTFTSFGDLFISNNVSLSRLNVNYTFDRFGPLQGLPYNQIMSVHYFNYCPSVTKYRKKAKSVHGGTVWIGTRKGYALFDVKSSKFFGYFYGPRWHSGEAVLGFASGGRNVTILLTDGGVTVVYPEKWTLERKASHYQAMLARHTRPPGEEVGSIPNLAHYLSS